MARPHKQTVDYFPHDADAATGDTLTVLQSRFGNDGYAFWFKLLEKLSSAEGHYIDCRNSNKWQLLLAKTGVNEVTGVEIMKLLVEMQAVDKDLWASKLIWCQKLVDNIADVYKNRRRDIPQKPVTTKNNKITTDENAITTDESTQSKVEYSRVDNIYTNLFKLWNELKITIHKKLTADTKRAIDAASKDYSVEEISLAIKNYAHILKGTEYYFKYTWTLKDFLKRGLEKFLDLNIAQQNYLTKGGQGGTHQQNTRQLRDRTKYTPDGS